MKFLFDLPNETLLPATVDLAEAVSDLVKISGIKELRAEVLEGEKKEAAAAKTAKKMIYRLCQEYPKETGAVLDRFWVLENENEKAPNAIVTVGIVLLKKDVMSFFTSLMQLGL